jgi:hypothetical protein
VGICIFNIRIKNYVRERKTINDLNSSFERKEKKEVKENPNSVANRRFHCLVALKRFYYLVANGMRRRSSFSPLPIFPQQILLKPSFFPLILRFYFTMVLGHSLCISSLFFDL